MRRATATVARSRGVYGHQGAAGAGRPASHLRCRGSPARPGKGWLLLIGVAVVAGVLIGNVQQAAVAADVVDHAVLSAFEGIRTPWLTQAARAAGVLSTRPARMLAVWWATLVVLVIWRRWRHLLVCPSRCSW